MGSFSEDSSEKNKLIQGIWAGVSSNDAISSPARTKRLDCHHMTVKIDYNAETILLELLQSMIM
jgi:hypothetical protein